MKWNLGKIKYCILSAAMLLSLQNCSKNYSKPGSEPQFIPGNFIDITYEIEDEKCMRIFYDKERNYTLDEVTVFCGDEKKVLRPGDPGFEEQDEVYRKQILPLYFTSTVYSK